MSWFAGRLAAAGVLAALVGGCATIPRERAAGQIDENLAAQGLPPPAWQPTPEAGEAAQSRASELLNEPLTVDTAVQIAFVRNARIREIWAQLGVAEANVFDALRPANPTFGYVDLSPRDGAGRSQVTRSVSLNLADFLLLPARSRLARGEYERTRDRVTNELVGLAVDVERAWYQHVGARQVAEMRAAVAEAAQTSAEFAERSSAAGNLTPRDLALERAAAGEARIQAARSDAEVLRTRAALAEVLGISTRDDWDTVRRLAAAPDVPATQGDLVGKALSNRLDVAASRREVALLEDALGVARRWRFLGDFSAGYERESETDGARVHGPVLALQLPIFNQGQGRILRAEAELEAAHARLAALELRVRNDVALGLDRVDMARAIAETYRIVLVPQREEIVRRESERYNFMLGGVFELLQARRFEFDAYQAYLESVRDYWIACADLTRALGGQRACESSGDATIGVEEILEAPRGEMQEMDHSTMDHSHTAHEAKADGEPR